AVAERSYADILPEMDLKVLLLREIKRLSLKGDREFEPLSLRLWVSGVNSDDEGCFGEGLTTGGAPTQLFEEWSQRVQFRTKASPVTGFQLLDSAVVVAQGLPRSIGLGAGERRFSWCPRER